MNAGGHEWRSGWTLADSPQIGELSAPCHSEFWRAGLRPHLSYRDLGLGAATDGLLTAQHIRTIGRAGEMRSDWHCHDVDFQFFLVLCGSITMETFAGDRHVLRAGGSGFQPPFCIHREYDFSEDYEVVEFMSPASFETLPGEGPLPSRAGGDYAESRAVYTDDHPGLYLQESPDSPVTYRDLGTRAATGGRIGLWLARVAAERDGGDGSYRSRAQWLMVLDGTAEIETTSGLSYLNEAGDAAGTGADPIAGCLVRPGEGPYAALELHIPAHPSPLHADAE